MPLNEGVRSSVGEEMGLSVTFGLEAWIVNVTVSLKPAGLPIELACSAIAV